MSETARRRLAAPLHEPRLVAIYFRERPGFTLRVFVWWPIVHALVCSWRGHVQTENVSRILGMCDRCGCDGVGP